MMRNLRRRCPVVIVVALLILVLGLLCFPPRGAGEEPRGPATTSASHRPQLEQLIPHWEHGDHWAVETVSKPLHIRSDVSGATGPPIRWRFVVAGSEKASMHDCFRVEITCQAAGEQNPKTVLWLDRESLALRKITTQMPVPGGLREMTVRYDSTSGQPAPILGPLTALPIDTPVWYSGGKGLQTFTYQSHFGPAGRKSIGDVGFAHQVEQHVKVLPEEEVRKLFNQPSAKSITAGAFAKSAFAKSIVAGPVTEVRLKSCGREVRQLWQPRRPWPIYCDNGATVCRLVAAGTQDDDSSSEEN